MAIKIEFDSTNTVQSPTFVLATKKGRKLGTIPAYNIVFKDGLNTYSELSFRVNKTNNGEEYPLWNQVKDFKLIWCKEWNTWFEIYVEIDESNELVKNILAKSLGEAELSQINLYNIEINTEDDISRDDYKITVLYNSNDHEASLLHRITEKAPHYSIIHVDSTIANIQRTFSFDSTSIYDAFQEIAEEIHCLFVFHSNSDENGKIQRTISVYDLESNCNDCGHRGEFTGICPECGSSDINEGYGEDTTIFVTPDVLASDIQFTTDTDSVKNCFKLEAGDDLMTATVRNCNPNGTDYIWYLSNTVKEDMSDELIEKLESYDNLYKHYTDDFVANIDNDKLSQFNSIAMKYNLYGKHENIIHPPIKGYPELMQAYYNTIDLAAFLQSELMPNAEISDTSATEQANLLTVANLSPVAVANINSASESTVESAILAMAKVIVDSRYQIKVNTVYYNTSKKVWIGNFTVTNYSDEEDKAVSSTINISINDDYEKFVKQKLQKALNKKDAKDLSISGLFEKENADFKNELKKYCLNRLISFNDACQTCIDILQEQGIADGETWSGKNPNLYIDLYKNGYVAKKALIEAEMKIREDEINDILGVYNDNNELITEGIQNSIDNIRNEIQNTLNFEKYLGEDLWLEFCTYRREDKYSNSNYISDGLNNAELFKKSFEFIKVAKNEIYKSAELQHSISTTLKNLLVIPKFRPLVKYFKTGNWIRIKVDDKIYKLRLLSYEIDFDNLEHINVEFSDVMKIASGINDVKSILSQASSMATSYDSVKRQASQGADGNKVINGWFENGLNATNTKIIGGADNQTQTWDSHGLLFRKYDDITDSYDPCQFKIINSTASITKDNWETVSTAIGGIYYQDPVTGELKYNYGVNAEVLVGRLILGEELGIYNKDSSMTFDEKGLFVSRNILNENNQVTGITSGVKINPSLGTCDFYYGGRENSNLVGRIGTFCDKDDKSRKGLVISLDSRGSYMGFAYDNDGDVSTAYVSKFMYFAKDYPAKNSNNTTITLNAGLWAMDNFYLGSPMYTGGRPIYIDSNKKTRIEEFNDGYSGFYSNKGIRIWTTSGNIDIRSNMNMNGYSILNQSDARLKTNIEDTNVNALDKINQIEMKEFDWIENNEHENIGMIAQQLKNVLPELIYQDEETDKMSIKTDKFIPYLIKAVQELYALISEKENITVKTNKIVKTPKSVKNTSWNDKYSLSEKQAFVRNNVTEKKPKQKEKIKIYIPK